MENTRILNTVKRVRPNYKTLPELAEQTKFITYDQLSKELLVSKLQVALALRDANVEPFAKKAEVDPETGKKRRGAPTLCFEPTVAKGAVLAKYAKTEAHAG